MINFWKQAGRMALGGGIVVLASVRAVASVTGVSEPVGFSTLSLLPSSDTWVSLSFYRPTVAAGIVSTVAGNVVSIGGTPGWSPSQFVHVTGTQPNTYFLLITSGLAEGRAFTVTGNAASTVTVNLAEETLTGLAAGDAIRIIPYWTLGTLFPAAAAGVSFTSTTNVASPETVIALLDPPSVGINPAPPSSFFFFSGAWRQTGQDVAVNLNDQIVRLHVPLRIRNATSGGSLVAAGAVVLGKLAVPIRTQIGAAQDNPLALARPVSLTLDGSGLALSGAFLASSSALVRGDLLMVTDNTLAGFNKAASIYYIYYNSAWRKLGQDLTLDVGSDVVFDPSKVVSIRTVPSTDGAPRRWINSATY